MAVCATRARGRSASRTLAVPTSAAARSPAPATQTSVTTSVLTVSWTPEAGSPTSSVPPSTGTDRTR
ncbi:hypothetical protein DQ392_32375 [Streptomyces reniochalinae]|uniref:Uncharacterized protein n=1 Tax=Streptomyces reniochalinae TaxID=2250578 RepID=A0A367E658_9ACTN|nr:hypothetical protein DQ392_32375 [Streptomyces reniochalinae]